MPDDLELSPALPDWSGIPIDDDAEPDDADIAHDASRDDVDAEIDR